MRPIRGTVRDSGGGEIIVVVDSNTLAYPGSGARVLIDIAPEWEPTEEQVEAFCVEQWRPPYGDSIRQVARANLKAAAKVLGVDQ